jgi:hypothetical protein
MSLQNIRALFAKTISLQSIQTTSVNVLATQALRFPTRIQDVPSQALEWVKANPGQTCFYVTNGIMVLTPAAVSSPLLGILGFGAQGPVAGEFIPFALLSLSLQATIPRGSGGCALETWLAADSVAAL